MTVQPPGVEPRSAPPPVQDRRAPDRRSGGPGRRTEDRAQLMRTALVAVTTICGGFAVLFLFFALLGTIDFENAIGSVIVAVVLAAVWFAGFWYRHRHEDVVAARHDRERRGF
jgi:protein-S-isoprenylcysteine O-methyltransferase Ste14